MTRSPVPSSPVHRATDSAVPPAFQPGPGQTSRVSCSGRRCSLWPLSALWMFVLWIARCFNYYCPLSGSWFNGWFAALWLRGGGTAENKYYFLIVIPSCVLMWGRGRLLTAWPLQQLLVHMPFPPDVKQHPLCSCSGDRCSGAPQTLSCPGARSEGKKNQGGKMPWLVSWAVSTVPSVLKLPSDRGPEAHLRGAGSCDENPKLSPLFRFRLWQEGSSCP